MTKYFMLEVNSHISNEGFVRNVVASFVLDINPSMNEITELKTIVAEAFSNAVIHGNSDKVYITCKLENHILTIIVRDEGKGIKDINKARIPLYTTLRKEEHSGMGLTIIEDLCDEFHITSNNLGTTLTIKKVFIQYNETR